MFIRVDLPEPELPITATKSPCSMSRLTPCGSPVSGSSGPRSACTVASPCPYDLVSRRIRITGTGAAGTRLSMT